MNERITLLILGLLLSALGGTAATKGFIWTDADTPPETPAYERPAWDAAAPSR